MEETNVIIGSAPPQLPVLPSQNNMNAGAMPNEQSLTIQQHLKKYWRQYTLIFLLYSALYIFIFRDVIGAIPGIFRGDVIVASDELVPIFDWHSQFFDQLKGDFSDLTSGFEFRLRYTALTTWMRYYKILPFALTISSILFTFLSCVAISIFLRRFVREEVETGMLIRGAALSALLINLILVYAKNIHFYSLIIGFNLHLVSLLLALNALLIARSQRSVLMSAVAASIIAVLSPSIHFVVLYLITISALCIILASTAIFGSMWGNGVNRGMIKREIFIKIQIALLTAIFLVVIPYALFVKFFVLTGIENITDTVPVNYNVIQTSSLSLIQQFALEIGAVTDNFLLGKYVTSFMRWQKSAFFVLAMLIFLPSVRKRILRSEPPNHMLLCSLAGLTIFSVWSAMGYPAYPFPTFHVIVAAIARFLYSADSNVTDTILSGLATTMQILRFPHRFQFITFAVIALLMPLGIVWLELMLRRMFVRSNVSPKKYEGRVAAFVLSIALFIPLFSSWEYRHTLLSGDLAGFFAPYPVGALHELRDVLDALPAGKVIVLPPSETQKRIEDENGQIHKFIDKLYIYYLNKPSIYYGLTGNEENKIPFFLLYESLEANSHYWINILRDVQIQYVIVNKELKANNILGVNEYLPEAERRLPAQIKAAPSLFRKIFENDGFALFEFVEQPDAPLRNVLLNLDWTAYKELLERTLNFTTNNHMVLNGNALSIKRPLIVVTSNREKAEKDVFALMHQDHFLRPDCSSFAFNPNHIPSSRYFGIIYAMFTTLKASKYNYLNISMHGIFDTLTGTFVGLPQKTSIRFPLSIPTQGEYTVYLRGTFTKNTVTMDWDGTESPERVIDESDSLTRYATIKSLQMEAPEYVNPADYSQGDLEKTIPSKIYPISNQFTYINLGTIQAKKGKDWLYLHKLDNNPMVVEGVLIVRKDQEKELLTPPPNVTFLTPEQFVP